MIRGYRKGTLNIFKHHGGGTGARYRDATDIEDAAHAINEINKRKKREDREKQNEPKKVTLPGGDALATWLKKETDNG